MHAKIIVLPGDGIGPEVTSEGVRVLKRVAEKFSHHFDFQAHLMGGCAIDATGKALPDETLEACKHADAILLGAVGGPKWDNPRAPTRPEDGLLGLRKGLELYANLRPVKPHPALADISPLRAERLRGVDFIVVRELTGGLYFGQPKARYKTERGTRAVDTLEYHDHEIARIVDRACRLAQMRNRRVMSVDKANVLESSRLWRSVATERAKMFPEVKLEHMLVDTCAMQLVMSPSRFDVIVTENTFGDILTDEAAVIVGSMGLLPSASLGDGTRGVYEPIHGSAPDIAGQGIANPIGAILSTAMLLRHSLNLSREAKVIERAVDHVLSAGCRTRDIASPGAQTVSTTQMTDAILAGI